jgi:hypothetical protein
MSTEIAWRHPRGSSLILECRMFRMKKGTVERRISSPCPVYCICSTPCNHKTATPLREKQIFDNNKAAVFYSIAVEFGERTCNEFMPFEQNLVMAPYGQSCPVIRHCGNACLYPKRGVCESWKEGDCHVDLTGCSFPGIAQDGIYIGKNTTKANCVKQA